MSRSTRKPFKGAGFARMKWWKRVASRAVRNTDDVPNGKQYKRLEDIWGSPIDGPKIYHGKDPNPKLRRK